MYFVILTVTFATFLSSVHLLPGVAKFLPEMLSVLVAAFVIVAGAQGGFGRVSAKYWLAFSVTAVALLCGALANFEAPGPLMAGLRYYVRCIPFFFVPAICKFDERQLWKFMRLILAICLIQLPISAYQRFRLVATGHNSGDKVYGSLMLSGTLSLFLICVLCVLTVLAVRKRVGIPTYVGLFVALLLPMSINETKITFFVLPPCLLASFVFASDRGKRLRIAAVGVSALCVAGAIFIPLYDYFNALYSYDEHPFRIEDYFDPKSTTNDTLETGASVGRRREAGRIDCVVVPLQELSRDPIKLAFGLGMGAISKSSLGPAYTGRYNGIYGRYQSSLGTFLFETGLLGTAMIAVLHGLIFLDALAVARQDKGLTGMLAVGWLPTVLLASLGLFYIDLHIYESFGYLFWFFSGWIAFQRARERGPPDAAGHVAGPR